jgi:hypothetical protein
MKALGTENGKQLFHLSKRELALLLALLKRYPLVPPAYQRLSKSAQAKHESDQRLLEEALAERRQENKRQIENLLKNRAVLSETQGGWRLALSPSEMEWVLQVLNDIRVGSWILLGAPPDNLWNFDLNEANAPQAWAMEVAGRFELHLLAALGPDSAP